MLKFLRKLPSFLSYIVQESNQTRMMQRSIRIVAQLWALFFAAYFVAPAVQSKFLSDEDSGDLVSGATRLRATAASSRTLEERLDDNDDLDPYDDFYTRDDVIFCDDFLYGDHYIYGDIESIFQQDKNLFTCLIYDVTDDNVDVVDDVVDDDDKRWDFWNTNDKFLNSVPGRSISLGLGLNFQAEAQAILLKDCDLLDGFLLQQDGPLTCDVLGENNTYVTSTVTGFAQCFPNTEACSNIADANLFISYFFHIHGFGQGGGCNHSDFVFDPNLTSVFDPYDSVIEEEETEEEEPMVGEEEEEKEEAVIDEEIVDPEPDDAVVPLLPPEENPPDEVMTTVIVVTSDPEPEPEFPFQNLVVGRDGGPRTCK